MIIELHITNDFTFCLFFQFSLLDLVIVGIFNPRFSPVDEGFFVLFQKAVSQNKTVFTESSLIREEVGTALTTSRMVSAVSSRFSHRTPLPSNTRLRRHSDKKPVLDDGRPYIIYFRDRFLPRTYIIQLNMLSKSLVDNAQNGITTVTDHRRINKRIVF